MSGLALLIPGLLLHTPARALPLDGQPKILLHLTPQTMKNACAQGVLSDCQTAVISGSATPGGTFYYAYVLIAPGSLLSTTGAEFGISYDSGMPADRNNLSGVDIMGWKLCGNTEFQGGPNTWPEPLSSNVIFLSGCQSAEVSVAGYFYVAAYGNASLSLLNKATIGNAKVFACPSTTRVIVGSDDLGRASFYDASPTSGCNPCLGGPGCPPPIPVPGCSSSVAGPLSGQAPLDVTFTAVVSSPLGIAPYRYTYVSGAGPVINESSSSTAMFTYNVPGTYTAYLSVIDSQSPVRNSCQKSFTITVTPPPPLLCAATAMPDSGAAPLPVSFTGSASGGISPYTYAWDFGDGGVSVDQNPMHVYSGDGHYSAVLAVTDNAGVTTCTDTVSVAVVSELPPAKVAFVDQPLNGTAGQALAAPVTVEVQDVNGVRVTSATNSVTLSLAGNEEGATLTGTKTVNAVNGLATFNNLIVNRTGTYLLSASSTGLTSATSGAFTIQPGSPTQLMFLNAPPAGTAGQPLPSNVSVEVRDALGNRVTGATNNVVLSLTPASNDEGASLNGDASQNAVNGLATFSNLVVSLAGTYQLTAAAASLASATSAAFTVSAVALPPTQLAFQVQPPDGTAGQTLAPAVTVQIRDAQGALVTTATNTVTLTLINNEEGATLSGTLAVSAAGGVATFGDLGLTRAGTYQLTASAANLTQATSNAFAIAAGPASRLLFSAQPVNGTAGVALPSPVIVDIQDQYGNRIPTAANSVTLALTDNEETATLSGTTNVNAAAGAATFTNLIVNKTGSFRLAASATGLTGATSDAFTVSPNTGSLQLAFVTQPPSSGTVWQALAPAITVQIRDPLGNPVPTAMNSVTLTLANNEEGATLSGTTTVNAAGGLATFGNLVVQNVGSYSLQASSAGLGSTASNEFNIHAAAPARLSFLGQPGDQTAGKALTPPVTVRILDPYGNHVTTATNGVTVSLTNNEEGAMLGGTKTINATGGVATFGTLSIARAGTYQLVASATNLTMATSDNFTIQPDAAAQLVYLNAPGSGSAGLALPAISLELRDQHSNRATAATGAVSLTLLNNEEGATLSGTTVLNATAGFVQFDNVIVDRAGSYQLRAESAGLTPTTSGPFPIVPGPPARLQFVVPPMNGTAGGTLSPAITVEVLDAPGNRVTAATNSVTLDLANNEEGATLEGATAANAVSGVATFGTLSLRKAGVFQLVASAMNLDPATSGDFTISPGAPSRTAFLAQPGNGIAGMALAAPVTVGIRDQFENPVISASNSVMLELLNNDEGATLSGTTLMTAAGGVASFSPLLVDRPGIYALQASSPGLSPSTSATFQVVPDTAPTQLAILAQPANGTVDVALGAAVTVEIRDAQGDRVTAATNRVTLTLADNEENAGLSGTTFVDAVNGLATFGNLIIDRVGTYRLSAAAAGLQGATSGAFMVTAGPAANLVFPVQPANGIAGQVFAPAVQVEIQDARGNPVLSATNSITLELVNNEEGGALAGTTTKNAVNGVATFGDLSVNRTGTYSLRASSLPLSQTTSASFGIAPGPAARLAFLAQPVNATAGSPLPSPVTVEIQDEPGNRVTAAVNGVTLSLTDNGELASLTGTTTVNAVNGLATFNNLIVDRAGMYRLMAASGGLASATSSSFTTTGTATPVEVAFLTRGGHGFQLVAFPLDIADSRVVSVLDELWPPNAQRWRLGTWSPTKGTGGGYLTPDDGDLTQVRPGIGYWLVTDASRRIEYEGMVRAPADFEMSLPTAAGAYQIGNPFPKRVAVSTLRVRFSGESGDSLLMESRRFEPMVKGWNASSQRYYCAAVLDTLSGYWIRKKTAQAATLIFPYPAQDVDLPLECPAGTPEGAIWSLGIDVVSERGGSEPLLVGAALAGSSPSALDVSATPPPPGAALLTYLEGRDDPRPLVRDFEPSSETMEWTLIVNPELSSAPGRLRFDTSRTDPEWIITLLDLDSDAVFDVRRTPVVSVDRRTAPRRFRLAAERAGTAPDPPPPPGSFLSAYPNPFTDAVDFAPAAALSGQALRLEIYDLRGRLVRSILRKSVSESSPLTWDGRDTEGDRMSGGVFFVRYESAGHRGVLRVAKLK